MGDRNVDDVALVHQLQPWRDRGHDFSPDDLGLMPSNCIEGQCRAVCIRLDDLPKRNQTQFDQSLEAVADTAHQAAAHIDQIGHGIFHLLVSEERCDEFCTAVWFIAAGESTRQEDHL